MIKTKVLSIRTMKKVIRKKIMKFFIITIKTVIFLYIITLIFINGLHKYIEAKYIDKIWIHRVDSKEKLIEVNTIFDKYEVDVVFQSKNKLFDVNHPPAKSINLNLLDYFKAIKINNKNMFWLDFKNLSSENKQYAYNRIDTICKKLKIKHKQLIIESTNPKHLAIFRENGYMTSYYLPAHINKLKVNLVATKFEVINQMIIDTKPNFISADSVDYSLIKEHLHKLKMLTWSFQFYKFRIINPKVLISELKNVYFKNKILSDKNVKVVLFQYKSKNGDR